MITLIFDILHFSVDTVNFRWTERSQCIGGCGPNARCKAGICICNFDECKFLQLSGTCCTFYHPTLKRTCKPMVSVTGIKQPPSSVMMRNTENPSHLRGQIGASARTRTATRRSVTTLETTRHASFPPTPTSLITTVSSAGRC